MAPRAAVHRLGYERFSSAERTVAPIAKDDESARRGWTGSMSAFTSAIHELLRGSSRIRGDSRAMCELPP
ncbi:uncharacterized protein UV8b_07557 [Ustilaginoidea virens]|uniref:Uncharacterized protein n=1 Tax=Ustilaginoidea virens TaxID=1159556 RepID=A0A8E5MKX7_USTVR|nr:uncharacterized protein UV8b_07557 [Ustilaginoidea virens]QUC23316.1 hypothetical protein UV8b_07557 [Ustilaginoidea virens]